MKKFEYILYFFLIIIALNNPFLSSKIYIIAPILVLIYLIIKKVNKNTMNNIFKSSIYLLIFYIVYNSVLIYFDLNSIKTSIVSSILGLSLFILGYLIMLNKNSNDFIKIISIISFSSCIYVALSFMVTVKKYGLLNNKFYGAIIHIWDGVSIIKVTNMTSFVVLGSCLIGVLIAREKKEIKLILMSIIEVIITVLFSVFLGGRTAFMLIPFMLILTYLIVPNNFLEKIKFLLLIIIVFTISIYIWNYNVLNIKELVESTMLFEKFNKENILNNSRFNVWKEITQGLPYYPFGGKQIDISLNYAHNIFLDTIYYGGIQSCIFLVLFMVQYFCKTIIIILKDNNKTLCAILSSFLIGSLVYFSFEPALQGGGIMFSIFIFIFGMVSSYFYKLKNENINSIYKDEIAN